MPRTRVTLTNAYQDIGTGPATITVASSADRGRLFLNSVNTDDDTAIVDIVAGGDQFFESEPRTIYARGADIELIVDTGV